MHHQLPAKPTQAEQLLAVLSDGRWHTTKELVRRVGKTFAVTKSQLVAHGWPIERRSHSTKKHQHLYRLLDETEL